MPIRRKNAPLVSVIVPAYDVEDYLPTCLDSVLGQRHRALDVVVVDDGSPDGSGDIAERYAAHDDRVRVVHVANGGLGAARNVGLRHARGEYIAFADSDDVVPATAYAALLRRLERAGTGFVTGGVRRLTGDMTTEVPWLDRLHLGRDVVDVRAFPDLLGDVFAWNKLFHRAFWDAAGLSWPEGVRYEDQPTTTVAYLAGAVAVLDEPVYHWRVRDDGSSITQQRASVTDLADRWTTKRAALASVRATGDPALAEAFGSRVLPGDLWRYFELIPQGDDPWWRLLVDGVRELWGADGLLDADLPPVHRLVGWLVAADRRGDAAAVIRYRLEVDGPLPRIETPEGVRLDVPVIDAATVPAAALAIRDHER